MQMLSRARAYAESLYERVLLAEISETPSHIAVIQDGNRRYADKQGKEPTEGHRAGAETTRDLLQWCEDLDIHEVTLYAFSTENFKRPEHERETLFDLISEKLRELTDNEDIHKNGVRIRAIGETQQLPPRVQDAISYAEERTGDYDDFDLNVALAYGGRAELLGAARNIAREVETDTLDPAEVDVSTVETALYDGPTRDVDLIIRSGGDERTSNFLPWQANGNEAAVYFSAPYWPEFRKIDFLRSLRTYGNREQSWRRTRARRAHALVDALGSDGGAHARQTLDRFRHALPNSEQPEPETEPDGETTEVDPAS